MEEDCGCSIVVVWAKPETRRLAERPVRYIICLHLRYELFASYRFLIEKVSAFTLQQVPPLSPESVRKCFRREKIWKRERENLLENRFYKEHLY